jgi:NAD(P)-dependent dehydrogenase (short-subunit alcohol dehydrogenase family)
MDLEGEEYMSIIDAFRLDGKVAVVTGANTGLGQGMSVALAQAGAKVVGVARILRSLLKLMEENLLRL